MASFEQHVLQAKSNLRFFKEITDKSSYYDWQVTACFYTAVHLVNAHIAKVSNAHYRTHKETKNSISPDNPLAISPFTTDAHDKYVSLEKLSRRSRYLCNPEGNKEDDKTASITNLKHVRKSIVRLNDIMAYFKIIHGEDFEPIEISCPRLKAEIPKTLAYFKQAQPVA